MLPLQELHEASPGFLPAAARNLDSVAADGQLPLLDAH